MIYVKKISTSRVSLSVVYLVAFVVCQIFFSKRFIRHGSHSIPAYNWQATQAIYTHFHTLVKSASIWLWVLGFRKLEENEKNKNINKKLDWRLSDASMTKIPPPLT